MKRLAVVGAGPIGLAAALGGLRRGLDVHVFEQGEIGASLRRWGSTRFFSPLEMNVSPDVAAALGEHLPPGDAILTGPELAEKVLEPLARLPSLAGRIHQHQKVISIGRAGMIRGDYARHPLRAERPFRLLVESAEGERWHEADFVLDASGIFGTPAATGAGGVAAPGERKFATRIIRDLGALSARRDEVANRHVLLVGDGHSAANGILVLEALAKEAPETRVIWAFRAPNIRPCVEVASDPLPERHKIVSRANDLAARPPAWLKVERRASVEAINGQTSGPITATLSGGRSATVDAIISLTGYRPDHSFLSELAVAIAPATEGAAHLERALAGVTDCLSVPKVLSEDLASGEPGFYFVGSKSYGRASTFLLRNGYAQLETILTEIAR